MAAAILFAFRHVFRHFPESCRRTHITDYVYKVGSVSIEQLLLGYPPAYG
jgi:hypothetical protein